MNLNIAQPCLRQRWQWSYLLRAVLLGQLVVWCVSCADDDHTGSEGAQDNNNNTWTWTGPGNGRTSNGSSATGATTTGETTGGTISERVPCISDGNCRVDEICRNDVCVDGCRADTDCASNGLCIQFTCVEEGVGCRIDAQCAPGSFCEPTTQRCQEDNGACRPDGFEPNDISSEASELPLGQTQGTICALDNDYFALPVEINTTIDLRLTFPEAGGDLQLQLLNSASAPLVRSENATGGEESIRFNVPEPGVYYARIFGADSSVETSYTLTYGGSGAGSCQDDANEPNDSPDAATAIANNVVFDALVSCENNIDWYSFAAGPNQEVSVRLNFSHAEGDLNLFIAGPDGVQPIGQSTSMDDNEEVTFVAATPSLIYYARVVPAPGAETTYSLEVNTEGSEQPCTSNTDCLSGEVCFNGGCAIGDCVVDGDCNDGQICEQLSCIEGCREDGECGIGQICEQLSCVEGCREDDSCGDGQFCAQDSLTCVLIECAIDADCGVDELCVDRRCGFPNGALRLAGGGSEREGRVEIYANGQWGTVCDDSFGIEEAEVICRQLGFVGAESALNGFNHNFGDGSGQIWLDDLSCSGDESRLLDCNSGGLGIHNCSHSRDAGVVCQQSCTTSTDCLAGEVCDNAICAEGNCVSADECGPNEACRDRTCTYFECQQDADCTGAAEMCLDNFCGAVEGALRLIHGDDARSGRLEIYINGQWGTICDDGWTTANADVACRQLGFTGVESSDITIPNGSGDIWLDEVACTGDESRLLECGSNGIGNHNCSHSEDIGIRCLQEGD